MPITTSAKKALRGSLRKKEFNLSLKSQIEKSTRLFKKLVANKQLKEAGASFSQVQKALDKAVKKSYMRKNKAARIKSRLTSILKKATV